MYINLSEIDLTLFISVGGFDKRSEGTRQCGRLALQGGGGYVQLLATPQQGCHYRLPGEVQRGMGGGWTSITGTETQMCTLRYIIFLTMRYGVNPVFKNCCFCLKLGQVSLFLPSFFYLFYSRTQT